MVHGCLVQLIILKALRASTHPLLDVHDSNVTVEHEFIYSVFTIYCTDVFQGRGLSYIVVYLQWDTVCKCKQTRYLHDT